MERVFISYASEDEAIASRVVDGLERRGVRCWISSRDLPKGTQWTRVLDEAVSGSRVVVYLHSQHSSAENSWCLDELQLAKEQAKVVLPVRLDTTPVGPDRRLLLLRYQWLEATGPEEDWVAELAVALGGDQAEPTPNDSDVRRRAEVEATAPSAPGRPEHYRRFWTTYLDRVGAERPGWPSPRNPPTRHWLPARGPWPGTMLMPLFRSGNRLGHDLYIDRGSSEENLAMFHGLLANRNQIEAIYGGGLQWLDLPGRRACRIADETEGSVVDVDRHDEFIVWLIDRGDRMREALACHSEGL